MGLHPEIQNIRQREKERYRVAEKLDPGTKDLRLEVEKVYSQLKDLQHNKLLTETEKSAAIRKLLPSFNYKRGPGPASMVDNRPYTVHKASQLRQVFSSESKSRLRFRGEWICYLYDDQSVTQSYAAGFYEMILRRSHHVSLDVRKLATSSERAKDVADQAFRRRSDFSAEWRYLAHISRLEDYTEEKDLKEFEEQVRYWISPKEKFLNGSSEAFMTEFDRLLREHVSTREKIVDYVPYQDWLKHRTTWAGSGSSFVHGGHKFDLSERVDHTKWAYAWSSSDDELLKEFESEEPAYHKVIQKREVGKVRAVISADMKTYLRMKYLHDVYVSKMYNGWEISPIVMSRVQQMKMWERIAMIQGVRMPLDQSEFDQQQLKYLVLTILCTWWEFCPDSRLDFVFLVLIKSLEYAVVVLFYQDPITHRWYTLTLIYRNGVLSGWYWTALLDTVINYITALMAQIFAGVVALMLFCQGDDDAWEFAAMIEAVLVWASYVLMGFIVNPKKFYISRKNDEFLRKVVITHNDEQVVTGYPARSVTGLLWANPVGDETIESETLAAARLAQWTLLANRLSCDVYQLPIFKDLIGQTKKSAVQLRLWLETPRSLGGGGVSPFFYDWHRLEYIPWPQHTIQATQATREYSTFIQHPVNMKAITATMKTKPTLLEKKERELLPSKVEIVKVEQAKPLFNIQSVDLTSVPDQVSHVARRVPAGYNMTDYRLIDQDHLPPINDEYTLQSDILTKGMLSELLDGLKLVPATRMGWSTDYVSSLLQSHTRKAFNLLLATRRHRVSRWDWTRVCLSYELAVLRLPQKFRVAE